MSSELTGKQQELYDLMSDISEECYCAGWMMGNEYAIWAALTDGDRRYGMGEIGAEQLEKCRALSEELNGWIVWVDDEQDPHLPVEEWGPRFIPMDRWREMAAANRKGDG